MLDRFRRFVGELFVGDPPVDPDMPPGTDKRLNRIVSFSRADTGRLVKELTPYFLQFGADNHDLIIIGHYLTEAFADEKIEKESDHLNEPTRKRFAMEVSAVTEEKVSRHLNFLARGTVQGVIHSDHSQDVVDIDHNDYINYLQSARKIAEEAVRLDEMKFHASEYLRISAISIELSRMRQIRGYEPFPPSAFSKRLK